MNRTATAAMSTATLPNGGNIDLSKAEKDAQAVLTPVTPTKLQPRVAHSLLVSSIMQAGLGFKTAIVTEVAVCLAVFAQFRGTAVGAKKELLKVYKEAGYQCEVGGNGRDYKTVSRRMGYAADLYNSLPAGTVEEWMGDETHDSAALTAVVNHLTVEYNFRSMQDVLSAAGKAVQEKQVKKVEGPAGGEGEGLGGQQQGQGPQTGGDKPAPQGGGAAPEQPKAATPTKTDQAVIDAAKKRVDSGEQPTERQANIMAKYGISFDKAPDEADKGVMQAMDAAAAQRNADQARREMDTDKFVKLTFNGATIILPRDMSRSDLSDLGLKLMTVANSTKGDKVDATALEAAFKETATA